MQRLRLEQTHKKLVLGGVLALSLLGTLIWGVPSYAVSRIAERAERAGFALTIGGSSLSWSGLSLSDVQVRSTADGRTIARIGELDLGLRWTALGEGSGALDAVALSGARIELAAADLERRAKPGEAKPQEASVTRPLPALSCEDVTITLSDAAGQLLFLEKLHATAEDGKFEVRAGSVSVGSAPGEVASLQGLTVSGVLQGRRPTVERAKAEEASLVWTSDSATAPPNANDPFPPARGRTLARLSALRRKLAPAEEATKAEAGAQGAKSPLWTENARFELVRGRVLDGDPSKGGAVIFDKLAVRVDAQGKDALQAKGGGVEPSGGRLAWDLRVRPHDRTLEGKIEVDDVSLELFSPALPPLPFFDLRSTRVHANLVVKDDGAEAMAFQGKVDLRSLAFSSPGLAHAPVGPFSLAVEGEGTVTPSRRELTIREGHVQLGKAKIALNGAFAWPEDGYRVDLNAELAKAACQDVLAAVPMGLLDELAAIQLSGTFGGKLLVHVDAADLDSTKVDFDIQDKCKFGALPSMLDLGRFQRPFAHQVLEPDGTVFEMETGPGTPNWTPIEYVSPFFIQAVIAHEDGRFFGHRGFAEPEIGVALSRNLKAKAFKFGASTITMQLVKNVFLHRDKLLARKVQEALIVWWLEQHWDKRRILELYLNVIEYGPAIYGIRNASMHYFGVLPMDLTPAQAGFLACILPSPKSSHVHYEKGALSNSAKNRITNLLKHMQSRERIDAEALAYGLEELEQFRFYNPNLPPPVPPQVRGTAQRPPFHTAGTILDPWESFLPAEGAGETGGFGNP